MKWTIYVPEDIGLKVDLFILDPVYGTARTGLRNQLVVSLLRKWLSDKVRVPPLSEAPEPEFPPLSEDPPL